MPSLIVTAIACAVVFPATNTYYGATAYTDVSPAVVEADRGRYSDFGEYIEYSGYPNEAVVEAVEFWPHRSAWPRLHCKNFVVDDNAATALPYADGEVAS